METASKALLIAAAVLIVIIIIAVGMKIYSSTTDAQKEGINTGKTISEKTGEATDLAKIEINGGQEIQYIRNLGEINEQKITVDEVEYGDSIKINDEKFYVFSKSNVEIKAIGYYNLNINEEPIKQATLETRLAAGEIPFSKTKYWSDDRGYIDIENENNNIYQYFLKYEKMLKKMGIKNIRIDIPYRFEGANVLRYKSDQGIIKLPYNFFWTRSSQGGTESIWIIASIGGENGKNYSDSCGVRPIITITK